jgi:tRNA-uridine 2-sulfurtransferase
MRVLVAMSGGVDSSVAALLLREQGHEVVGATMKLWGGESDSGCCSVSDVEDARRVADTIGITHRVFNFTDEFSEAVIGPYVEAHRLGHTPNPCIDCNTSLKFGAFLERAMRLDFEAVATGHHARLEVVKGRVLLRRGVDAKKDQSYVLSTLTSRELCRVLLPIGTRTKAEVRELARRFGLRTAEKKESQDVCFITSRTDQDARREFLRRRIPLHPGRIVDVHTGAPLGEVEAVEVVTVGQRRRLGVLGGERRYAVGVDAARKTVFAGSEHDLLVDEVGFARRTWVDGALPVGAPLVVQASAHGAGRRARVSEDGVVFERPERRVAPGQVVACYVDDVVVGSGVAA